MEPFRVTLPSNTSSHEYAENTAANFKTYLAKPIHLEGEWEVAMTHMWFNASWYNIKESQFVGICDLENLREENEYDTVTPYIHLERSIPPGLYTIDELCFAVNEILQSAYKTLLKNRVLPRENTAPKLHIDKVSRRVNIALGFSALRKISPLFSPYLSNILGINEKIFQINKNGPNGSYAAVKKAELVKFSSGEKADIKKKLNSATPYDLSAGVHALYVYTNIVKPNHVGDSYTQLLKAIPLTLHGVDFGDVIDKEFTHPIFVPVQSNYIQMIEIDCKDDTGDTFPFEMGKTVVELYFRPRKL